MRTTALICGLLAALASAAAAVGLPPTPHAGGGLMIQPSSSRSRSWFSPRGGSRAPMAMAGAYRRSSRSGSYCRPGAVAAQLGGDVVTDTFFGGLSNFLQLYNIVLTGRILLSWFPNIARQPVFEPLFVVTNPFFSIFRGLIPPIGGIDLSPLPAFFLLSFVTNATQSLGAELPSSAANGKRPGAATGGAMAGRRSRRSAPLAAVMLQRQQAVMSAFSRVQMPTLPRSLLPSLAVMPSARK